MAHTITPPRTNGAIDYITSGGQNILGGVTDLTIATNTESSADDSGSVYDDTRSITNQQPTAAFTMKDWVKLLDLIGITGTCLQAPDQVHIYQELHDACIGRATGNVHSLYAFLNGVIVPDTLTASVDADATMSFMVHGISVDGAAPFTWNYLTGLPPHPVTDQYTLGACQLDITGYNSAQAPETVQIPQDDIQNISLSFNVEVRKRGGPGTVWPLWASLVKVRPRLVVSTVNTTLLQTDSPIKIPLLGGLANHSTGVGAAMARTLLQFVKKERGATFQPKASTVHYAMSMSGLCYVTTPTSASGQADGTLEYVIEGMYDGTNAPLLTYSGVAYRDSSEL